MFLDFFYLLRKYGLDVSIGEWMTLMEGLQKGLHRQSLMGFYHLSRAVVVKSEADFDRFDLAFADAFRDVPLEGPVPEEIMAYLTRPSDQLDRDFADEKLRLLMGNMEKYSFEELYRKMQEVLEEQNNEEHNGGRKWVGTQGFTGYGNSGWFPGGIRVGGEGMHRTAVSVAGERRYRDFRTDKVLDERQFQVAFRKLRIFSSMNEEMEKELDMDATVRDTGNSGGLLKIRMKNPRRNAVKLLLLMDSGGSMQVFSRLCSTLFHAATKSNYFKELHTYFFHNCIFRNLYASPELSLGETISTEWVLRNYGGDYKVIIVGDAAMEPDELYGHRYIWSTKSYHELTGYDYLMRFKERYPYLIWLNPDPLPRTRGYLTKTHLDLAEMFPMYDLSVDGLEEGIRALMARR